MSAGGLDFARSNLGKLLRAPVFALGWLLSWVIPRSAGRWAFGSGIGVGEGALVVARELRRTDPDARIWWLVGSEAERAAAHAERFAAIPRNSLAGWWVTARARHLVVTHGLGDVTRSGVFGGQVTHLVHGAPLKRLHLDSPVTTAVTGPLILRRLLLRMYRSGGTRIALFAAGSVTAAERLRTAYRVAPGRVRVLGDPRDDALCAQARDPELARDARRRLAELLDLDPESVTGPSAERLVLYAPTWRDGGPDPGVPDAETAASLRTWCEENRVRLVVRAHPLGAGAYDQWLGGCVHGLPATRVPDLTPLLGAFDALITDYSSAAIDFSLLHRPIVWFAPDHDEYVLSRGLYEPLSVTAAGQVVHEWDAVRRRLAAVLEPGVRRSSAIADARALAERFHAFPEGGAAGRVLAEIRRIAQPSATLVRAEGIFFESFYGRLATCNPCALDREIAHRAPEIPRYWSVQSERVAVPDGAIPLLVGGPDWHAARRHVRLLVVNDWLRYGFRRRAGQTVLQTWHGTMLKRLALARPQVPLRTRIAIRRESRRWSAVLSQNPHSTAQFRSSYAVRGDILELGYPRDDRLVRSLAGAERSPYEIAAARRALGVPPDNRVLVYAPTWRESGTAPVDTLDLSAVARELGPAWTILARGHSRMHGLGSYARIAGAEPTAEVRDASGHPEVNDLILAADLLVTDYSSIMFDAAAARVPTVLFVPDLVAYRDRERGFTFDLDALRPGPVTGERERVIHSARQLERIDGHAMWQDEHAATLAAFRETFLPWDDGSAAARVVDALIDRGSIRTLSSGA